MPVDYHAWTHAPKADGGTDPIPFPTNSYCWMRWAGPEVVTVNTLLNPAILGTPDIPYEEGFIVENDQASFDVNLTAGIIEWGNPGEYLATGWANFNGGATVGSSLGVVIDLGSSGGFSTFRVGNQIIADGINEGFRITVTTPVFSFNPGVFGHDSVRLLVYHDDASGQDLNSAQLHVIRLNPSVAGEFYIPS